MLADQMHLKLVDRISAIVRARDEGAFRNPFRVPREGHDHAREIKVL